MSNFYGSNELQLKPIVFFSHASADTVKVELIAEHARSVGVEPYMAIHDYQPGRKLADKIVEAIESSDAVFVFLTQRGYDAHYVHQEIGVAVAKNKVIIALVDPDLDSGGQDLAMLQGSETVPFSFTNPTIEGMVQLVAAMHRITQQNEGANVKKSIQPGTLNVTVRADLQLSVDDLLKGVFVAAIVIGVIYLASRPPSA